MPDALDTFSFDKGLNLRKNPTILTEGETQVCSGFSLDNDGYLKPMKPRSQVHHSPYGEIRNIHRYQNNLIMAEGENIRYKWDMRGYCDLYIPPDEEFTTVGTGWASRYKMVNYKNWVFMANGRANKVFSLGTLFDWGVANPTVSCGGAAGASGNPNGTYNLYYTFLIKFPNGEMYETGPSSPTTVSVTNQKIEWSNIGVCPYNEPSVEINRCLYRYSTTLLATYYVTTIGNNTTTTYSDNATDASLETNEQLSTTSYTTCPDGFTDIDLYLQRIFGIKGTYMYWSEPYLPFNFLTTSSINVSDVGNELTSISFWGDQLYLSSKARWYRLSGSDPDTWAIKNTFADTGCINPHTVKVTKYGIPGLSYDGIYIFDGSISKNVTEKKLGRKMFLDISDYDACFSEFDGEKYYFYYPESGSTLSKCLIIDFTFYPEFRFYNDPFVATAHSFHKPTGRRYLARLD
jgi:hypothetical protein